MTPYHDEGQTITGVLLTFRDVSTELEMEESANKNHLRLSRFNKTFVGFSSDPAININRLIAVLGEMLGASCCSYSRFENGKTISSASWKSPFLTDFDPGLTEKILADRLITEKVDFLFLPKPHLLTYFADNPLLQEKFGIKTLLGVAVRSGNRLSGFIALSFTFNYSFKSDDREFVSLVSSALALEDSRTMLTGASVVDDLNYRELFNFFTDAIYIMSPDGNFLDVNSGAIKMDGYSKEEIIGQTFEKLSAPGKNDLDAAKEAINKAFQGESLSIDWWGQRKSGEVFPKNLVLNRGRYFGESVVIAIGRDITERKLVEEKLIQYNQELKEINQSKDKFFSILAHDLKNPFGGLLGFIDLLYEDIDDLSSDQVKEYLQNIRTASYHTYSLLENLLEWSRIQTGKVPFRPSFFDLGEEINSVLMVLEANAVRKNVKLVNLVGEGITAEADRNMIHSVIQNLVANAIKFSNSNCEVTIAGKLSLKGKDEPANDEMTQSRINWYELRITDTGVGIPDEIMPKLFRLDGQFSMAGTANEPGTGLGLILCKEMVEKNGGKIWADSVAGKGSTFSFTLPLKG
jgi:PAS domain S-box-containing protein